MPTISGNTYTEIVTLTWLNCRLDVVDGNDFFCVYFSARK